MINMYERKVVIGADGRCHAYLEKRNCTISLILNRLHQMFES